MLPTAGGPPPRRPSSGADVVVAAFAGLLPDEQEEAYTRIADARLTRLADAEGETAAFLRVLRRLADLNGGELTPALYRAGCRALRAAGEEVPDFSTVVRYFGSWSKAKEAVVLSEVATAQKIDARFQARIVGRRPHFNAQELGDALDACAAELGRVPLLSEYEEWREKELALMRARGEFPRLPSTAVFRRRHRGWEKALLAHGYSTEDVYVRLEPTPDRLGRVAKVDRYTEATLRESLLRCVLELGHVPVVAEYGAWRRRELARRTGPKALPADSPYRGRYGSWEGALRHFGFSEEEIRGRLDAGRERSTVSLRWHGFRRGAS